MKFGVMMDADFEGGLDKATVVFRKLPSSAKELDLKNIRITIYEEVD